MKPRSQQHLRKLDYLVGRSNPGVSRVGLISTFRFSGPDGGQNLPAQSTFTCFSSDILIPSNANVMITGRVRIENASGGAGDCEIAVFIGANEIDLLKPTIPNNGFLIVPFAGQLLAGSVTPGSFPAGIRFTPTVPMSLGATGGVACQYWGQVTTD